MLARISATFEAREAPGLFILLSSANAQLYAASCRVFYSEVCVKQVINDEGSRPIKIWTDEVEDTALHQLKNIARLPFIAGNGVACMPDVHAGIGATVGTVIATDKAIVPASVGVDIGCGMNAVRLSLKAHDLPESLTAIRHQIERDVPLGTGGSHRGGRLPMMHPGLHVRYIDLVAQHPGVHNKNMESQLGTLGSGNHFIELCIDEAQDVWVMLHSGSRGVGNLIGRYFIEKAKKRMEQFFISLPDADLAYFPEDTDDFNDYVEAVEWAQDYAFENRRVMMGAVIAALRRHIPIEFTITQEAINCFPGDTDVSAADVKTAFKRYYSGDMVTLTTKSGRKLTVTPNHPILTRAGWVKAGEIDVGHSLIGADRADVLGSGVDPDVQDMPIEFAQLFDSLGANGKIRRVFGAPVNFHGDVGLLADDREVDVVGTDLMLGYGRHASLLEQFRELGLLSPNLTESDGFGDRLLREFVGRSSDATASNVGAANDGAAFFGGHGLHSDAQGFAPIASLNASRFEKFGDARGADFGQLGEGFNRSAIGVSLDEVVDVVRGHWAGHVYNLSTESEWYFANGIIAHNCHHNYVARENHFGKNLWVTRKGAIRARDGDLGIIPGSMGQRSYIVRGKGNLQSYCSCSHGAGRQMSRAEARRRFQLADLVAQTEGVECRKDDAVLDEIPGAYKDIDVVMDNQRDLIDVVHVLKQVLCVKGA